MAMKEQQRQLHRSMQGKVVDMNKLVMQNEMAVAVGNVKVNARGDELGPGGKIIQEIQLTTNTTIVIEEVDNTGVIDIVSSNKEDTCPFSCKFTSNIFL